MTKQAMILAAGLGTRLRPLTNTRPKALVEVDGAPLLEHILKRLISVGVNEVIINLHHFPDQIIDFIGRKQNFGIRIEFSHEEQLLDTGGGLKKAGPFFDENRPFILHNVDVLTDIDIARMVRQHEETGALATLAVNRRRTSRYFIFDESNRLCGWENKQTHERIESRKPESKVESLAFCGIHVITPGIFEKFSEVGAFSIVHSYLRLAGAGELICAFNADEYQWRDVGKLQEVRKNQL
ncbi:MAG: NDP-sugar synthase [bacterium]